MAPAMPGCGRAPERAPETPFGDVADASGNLEVSIQVQYGRTLVAAVSGEIDLRNAQDLRARLTELVDSGLDLMVVDFSGVRFFDATGLGALIAVNKYLRQRGGEMRLARVRPPQVRLFQITGLDRILPLHNTLNTAIDQDPTPTTLGH